MQASGSDASPWTTPECPAVDCSQNTRPSIVIGEFGGSKRAYFSASQAAQALVSWQRQSCAYGTDGWLLWTWDSAEQPNLWNGADADGAIEAALAPARRPDPCA